MARKNLTTDAIPVEKMAEILSSAGKRRITKATIQGHINAGAPTNADGTINMMHYIAWLLVELEA